MHFWPHLPARQMRTHLRAARDQLAQSKRARPRTGPPPPLLREVFADRDAPAQAVLERARVVAQSRDNGMAWLSRLGTARAGP